MLSNAPLRNPDLSRDRPGVSRRRRTRRSRLPFRLTNRAPIDWWMPDWQAPAAFWARAGLLLGFVAIGTAGGALVGLVVDAFARAVITGLVSGTIPCASAILGFALGWWWAASVGQRWLAEEDAP